MGSRLGLIAHRAVLVLVPPSLSIEALGSSCRRAGIRSTPAYDLADAPPVTRWPLRVKSSPRDARAPSAAILLLNFLGSLSAPAPAFSKAQITTFRVMFERRLLQRSAAHSNPVGDAVGFASNRVAPHGNSDKPGLIPRTKRRAHPWARCNPQIQTARLAVPSGLRRFRKLPRSVGMRGSCRQREVAGISVAWRDEEKF